ncbi:hypothetical protein, partial [Tissierella sp.]|uniref:hypothetical protein n=1 Tax=Tissierella sp. TaxID=41274 RepID=UPI0028B1E9A7
MNQNKSDKDFKKSSKKQLTTLGKESMIVRVGCDTKLYKSTKRFRKSSKKQLTANEKFAILSKSPQGVTMNLE